MAEVDNLDDQDILQWTECHSNLNKKFHDEELSWQQRARTQWLLEGDANT